MLSIWIVCRLRFAGSKHTTITLTAKSYPAFLQTLIANREEPSGRALRPSTAIALPRLTSITAICESRRAIARE